VELLRENKSRMDFAVLSTISLISDSQAVLRQKLHLKTFPKNCALEPHCAAFLQKEVHRDSFFNIYVPRHPFDSLVPRNFSSSSNASGEGCQEQAFGHISTEGSLWHTIPQHNLPGSHECFTLP
jgi:hypothetical protein